MANVAGTKRAKIAEYVQDGKNWVVTFANGHREVLDSTLLGEEIAFQALMHGIKQKTADGYADAKGDVNVAIAGVQGIWAALCKGSWNQRGEGGNGKLPEALHRATEKPLADCVEVIKGMNEDQIKTLRKHPGIIKALAEMEQERAEKDLAKAGDLGDLFQL